MSFSSLGLSDPILKAIAEQGYTQPSPIQEQAIPAIIAGDDVMAAAQTGTGKTAGFTLPLLQKLQAGARVKSNHIRALVLTPTRELAAQVQDSVFKYSKHLPLRSDVVFGGVKINPQMMRLRKGVDVLVATPGRLLDLHSQNAIKFDQLEVLVLDEADRMLDMGFIHDLKRIMRLLPKQRQNLLFSATFSDEIRQLAKGLVNNPVEISVTPPNTTVEKIEQWIHVVDKAHKSKALIDIIIDNDWQQVLVFSRTKHGANRIVKQLQAVAIESAAIHGNKSQGARTKALADFKAEKIRVLVATDIAARGIDIDQLPHVVNFDLPNVAEDYVHRIGRTGRAGATGEAVSLVCADEDKLLFAIESFIGEVLPRRELENYTPANNIRPSVLKPLKPKRPKKPKKRKKINQADNSQQQNKVKHSKASNTNESNEKAKPKPARNRRYKAKPNKTKQNNSQNSKPVAAK